MRKLLALLLLALPVICAGQVLKTSAVPYTKGATPYTPNISTNSEIRIDTSCSCLYWWDRDALTWRRSPYGVDVITGGIPPAYTPTNNMGLFAINASSELYYYNGSTWDQIGGAGVGGIYGGSGTVPAGTTATMDGNFAFANASAAAGERFSVTVDDGASTNYFELEAGQGILLQSSGDGIFLEGETGFTDVLASGALGANQNNYAGLDGANVGLLSASTAIDITGIANGFAGRILYIYNVGANTITLKNNNGSSIEANQFDIGADYELTGDNGVVLQYDGVATNWRIAGNKLSGAGGIYSGDGAIYAGGADVTFTGTNPLRFRASAASAEPIVQKLFSSGTTGYFDRWRINNDSLELLYGLGKFIWQAAGAGIAFGTDVGDVQMETALGIVTISGDSVKVTDMPERTELDFMVGADNNSYLKRIEGAAEGDIIAWDAAGGHWETRSGDSYAGVHTLRPAQLTATTNNWNPTGFSTTKAFQTIEFSGDGSFRTITGLLAGTRDGIERTLVNTGTNCVVIAKQHTSSDAGNRFNVSKDVIMLPSMEATFRYDSVGARWRLKSTNKEDVTYGNQASSALKANSGVTGSFHDFVFNNNGGSASSVGATSSGIGLRRFNFSTSTAATAFPNVTARTQYIFINDNVSYLRIYAKIKTGSALSTSAEDYDMRFGFKTSVDTNIVEGAYINYDRLENSGGWTLKTHDGTTLTTTNAGDPVATSTSYALELIYYPYGEVTAFINGTRYTTTSTLPADLGVVPFLMMDKDNGTTAVSFDCYGIEFDGVLVAE